MNLSPLVLFVLLASNGYDAVRDMPCATYEEQQAILATLRKHPMTAETYGVVRNMVTPREDFFIGASLPAGFKYAGDDEWHAAQAFIVALSPRHVNDGYKVFSEPFLSVSHMMYDLERMLLTMRPRDADDPMPYTAFLALANRVANEPLVETNECDLAGDAGRLLQFMGEPKPEWPDRHACRSAVEEFRAWLEQHRTELEAGAAKEADEVEAARVRMDRVALCR